MSSTLARWNRRQFQAALVGGLLLCSLPNHVDANEPRTMSSEPLVEANNAFALALLRVLNEASQGENHFFSPFSMQSALTMATEGARGDTAAEMGAALHYPESSKQAGELPWNFSELRTTFRAISERMQPDDSAKANELRQQIASLRSKLDKANEQAASLSRAGNFKEANAKSSEAANLAEQINMLAKQVDQYELSNANSLWVDESFKLSPKYQAIIADNYRPAHVVAADFRNKANDERLRINQWVSNQTKDKVRDIVPPGVINAMTRLVIANAIYFKGTWVTPFDPEFTKPEPFTKSDNQKVTVPLMNMSSFEEGKYAAFNADGSEFETPTKVDRDFDDRRGYPGDGGYQVIELPYNGDTLSMMIFLPKRADELDTLFRTLSVTQLDTCAEKLQQREVNLSLPKFKLESNYDLKRPLKELGMHLAFSDREADFSGLTEVRDVNHQLYISAVMHKAFVEVNEKGTEAAAATVVIFAPRAAFIPQRTFVPRFKADRPFLFVIRERASGLILFMGKVENPAE